MHKLISEKLYQESVTYQILGNEKQTLQLLLMPGQSIVTKNEAILYSSENITYQPVNRSLLFRFLYLI